MSIDRRELFANLPIALQGVLDGFQTQVWTALPGIIDDIDLGAQTAQVQPAIKGVISDPDGSAREVDLPMLLDVPIFFPSGGGVTCTFPVAKGGECLVVFASRCIDGWWQSGDVSLAPEFRMHDLSDGFAFVGFRSQPRRLSNVSASAAELRTDDGSAKISLDGQSKNIEATTPADLSATANNVNVTAQTVTKIQSPTIQLIGNVEIQGGFAQSVGVASFEKSISIANKDFLTHEHDNVQPGTGNSGGVV